MTQSTAFTTETKEDLFTAIKLIDPKKQFNLLNSCLNPETELGKRFTRTEGLFSDNYNLKLKNK